MPDDFLNVPAFRVDMLHKPLPEEMRAENAGSCLPIGLRLIRGEDGAPNRLVLTPVDDDLERDLNALCYHAFRSNEQLATGQTVSEDGYPTAADLISIAGGNLTVQIEALGKVMAHINDLALSALRDPEAPEYKLTALSVETYVNDETPYFVVAENILKGSGHKEGDPFEKAKKLTT